MKTIAIASTSRRASGFLDGYQDTSLARYSFGVCHARTVATCAPHFCVVPAWQSRVAWPANLQRAGKELQIGWLGPVHTVIKSDPFQHALWVKVKFALITVPIGLALGVGLAVLADKQLRGMRFFRNTLQSGSHQNKCESEVGPD